MSPNKRAAAFFDFDNTLLDADSAEIGIKYLYKRKMLSLAFALKIWGASKFYKLDLLSPERMALMCMKFYEGRDLALFERESEAYYHETLKPKLNHTMLEVVEERRRAGDVLVILSASVRYMLEPARKDLGFDRLICTDLEKGNDGLLTGRPADAVLLGTHKAAYARRFAENEGIDLSKSSAYSDHHSDVPMLEMVGNPAVVNPTKQLLKYAKKRGWPVIK